MDFRFELHEADPALKVIHRNSDGSSVIEFAIGYDLEVNTIVLMAVLLVPDDSYKRTQGEDVHDLQFGIRERLVDDEEICTVIDFSVISPRRFIPKAERNRVSRMICRAVGQLLAEIQPRGITIETYHANLQAKALAKYEPIFDVLRQIGYGLQENFVGPDGVNYWYYQLR